MDKSRIQSGNEGEELVPGKTENLSSSLHSQGDAARPHDRIDKEQVQRGQPASFDRKTGAVHGSGSNAGAGGTPGEDYDQDAQGGGTKPAVEPGGPGR